MKKQIYRILVILALFFNHIVIGSEAVTPSSSLQNVQNEQKTRKEELSQLQKASKKIVVEILKLQKEITNKTREIQEYNTKLLRTEKMNSAGLGRGKVKKKSNTSTTEPKINEPKITVTTLETFKTQLAALIENKEKKTKEATQNKSDIKIKIDQINKLETQIKELTSSSTTLPTNAKASTNTPTIATAPKDTASTLTYVDAETVSSKVVSSTNATIPQYDLEDDGLMVVSE